MDVSHIETDCHLKIEIEDEVALLTPDRPDEPSVLDLEFKGVLVRCRVGCSTDSAR